MHTRLPNNIVIPLLPFGSGRTSCEYAGRNQNIVSVCFLTFKDRLFFSVANIQNLLRTLCSLEQFLFNNRCVATNLFN